MKLFFRKENASTKSNSKIYNFQAIGVDFWLSKSDGLFYFI